MHYIDLNSDLGESFGAYTLADDAALLSKISSANIACGWHAGDPLTMAKTVALAKANGVSIGAHPGFNDLMGFGRREMAVSPKEFKAYIQYQIGALSAFASAEGLALRHVKLHGAMYNMAAVRPDLAKALAEAVYDVNPGLIVLGLAGSAMIREAQSLGLSTAEEVFADRAYNPDGTLVSRNLPGAVIHDSAEAAQRVVTMVKEGRVMAQNGQWIEMNPQSVCVHGDNAEALALIEEIRKQLSASGVMIRAMGE